MTIIKCPQPDQGEGWGDNEEDGEMKIIKITSQSRRDFWSDMECEGCGQIERHVSGYDDRNFHDNVIPAMKCKGCGKSRTDLGITGEKTATRYTEYETV